ncbi:MAG: cob(I)yrinic acid a,c-diamide adenosyltransferase [Candidatus Glassbacteria bacterium]
MKIYSGTGDRGQTSLYSGERVAKSHKRVEAYGTVDELNSVLGALLATLTDELSSISEEISLIQSNLLLAGSWLATASGPPPLKDQEKIGEAHTKLLESAIDRMEKQLPDLKGFILPGGHMTAALAHVARTVCRRAERHVVDLLDEAGEGSDSEPVRGVIVFLNRLSDYLFMLGRYLNKINGVPDRPWVR